MERASNFDSSWPVALAFGLISVFILGLTPAGQEMATTILKTFSPGRETVTPVPPARPDVLVATDNSDDQARVAATVVPRGYSVLVAGTAIIAQEFLQSHANRIGLIVVDSESGEAGRVARLARSLVPGAKLVRLPPKHGPTEVAVLLLAAI